MSSSVDRRALDELFSLCYEELRRLAGAMLRGDRAARLSPSTLVNEAWKKLAKAPEAANTSPLHFRRIAGRAMRQILVDAARRRQAQIHGGGQFEVTFDESLGIGTSNSDGRDVLALDATLDALEHISPRQSMLAEGRFFGGLSWAESAEALGVSGRVPLTLARVAPLCVAVVACACFAALSITLCL